MVETIMQQAAQTPTDETSTIAPGGFGTAISFEKI